MGLFIGWENELETVRCEMTYGNWMMMATYQCVQVWGRRGQEKIDDRCTERKGKKKMRKEELC